MKLLRDNSILVLLAPLLTTATSLQASYCIIKEIFNLKSLIDHSNRFVCIIQLYYQNI